MKVKRMKVADGKRLNIDQFPNFSVTGSVVGMKEKYYGQDALLIRCGSYIYCVSQNGRPSEYGRHLYYNRAY